MVEITATMLQKHIGEAFDNANKGPVLIKRHNRTNHILITIDQFKKLVADFAKNKEVDNIDDYIFKQKIESAIKGGFTQFKDKKELLKLIKD